MTLTLPLTGLALYILIWEKLPEWGSWFNRLLSLLPQPLQTLYQQWTCPYCSGFWIALALHGLTGLWTLPGLAGSALTGYGVPGLAAAWFLDALATGLLMACGKLALTALQGPALATMARRPALMAEIAAHKAAHSKTGS